MSGKRVVIISVKPLRPTVTGARVLFDNIVTYLSAHDGGDGFHRSVGRFGSGVAIAAPRVVGLAA